MKNSLKNMLSVALCMVLLAALLPTGLFAVKSNAATPLSCDQVTAIVENYISIVGSSRYWNADITSTATLKAQVDAGDYLSATTTHACSIPEGQKHLRANGCTSNNFTGVSGGIAQCWGFGDYMEYVIFKTTDGSDWTKTYSVSSDYQFKPGDLIHTTKGSSDQHIVVVYKVVDSHVYIIEANWGGRCHINTRELVDAYTYVNASGSYVMTPPSYLRTDDPGYANLGEDFYGVILNTACWKPISLNTETNKVTLESEHNVAYQKWHFTRQDDGAYRIESCANGKVLEMTNGTREVCSQITAHDDWWEGYYQQWYLIPQGDGYVFQSKHFTSEEWVMDLYAAHHDDGTIVQINNRNNSTAQVWSVYQGDDVQLKAPTLSVSAGTSTTKTVFTWDSIYGSKRYDVKIWQNEVDHNVSSYHTEWGATSGYSILLPPGTYEAYVTASDYFQIFGSENIKFTVTRDPSTDIGDDFFGYIIHSGSGKAIANYDGDVKLSAGKENDPRQIWHFYRVNGPSYVAYNTYDSSLLTADTADGTDVTSSARTGESDQRWYVRQINGNYYIFSVANEKAMSLAGGASAGADIQLSAYSGAATQRFSVYKFDDHSIAYAKPAAPAASVLSIKQQGFANEETVFEWTVSPLNSDKYDNRTYNFRIWQGEAVGNNGEEYILGSQLTGTSYSANLPAGTYTATVTAVNTKYHWYGTASAPITFTINAHEHADANKDGKCDECGYVMVAAPAVPQNVTVKATGDRQLTVSWDAVEGATQYNIFRYNGTQKAYLYKATRTITQFVDKGLYPNVTYHYKVVAVKKTEDYTLASKMSADASAKTVATPAAPTNVTVKATGNKQLTVSWDAVEGATQYNIFRYNGTQKAYLYKATRTITQFVDTGLYPGTNYHYKVVAVYKTADCTLVSDYSADAAAKAVGTPAVPTNVTAKATGDGQITVTWKAVTGATQYNIFRYNGTKKEYVYKGTTFATAAKPTQFVDTGLYPGTNYHYKVIAVCKGSGLTFVSDKSADASAKAK